MNRRFFILLLWFFVFNLGDIPASIAQTGLSPSPFVLKLIAQVKTVKKPEPDHNVALTPEEYEHKLQATRQINRMLNIQFISKYALLHYWEKLDDADRNRFISVFTELLSKVAYPNAGKFLEDLEITVRREKIIKQKAMVFTSVVHKEEGRIDIDFKLRRASGSWEIVDVYLDGVSLARNLRTQCLKIIRDHSFQELIARMTKKIEEKDTAHLKEVTGKD